MGKEKEKSGKGEGKKEPITKQQILDVQCSLGDVCEEIAFLHIAFNDIPPDMETEHLHGLSRILKHIHDDTYKSLDLLEELNLQAVDAEGG